MDTFEIPIRSDNEGFILLQCSLCGEFFKLLVSDINEKSNINIWCPYCGLNGKRYFTDEVLDVGLKIAKNEANKLIYESFKKLERETRNNKFMTFKCSRQLDKEVITPIKPRSENLEIKKYECCKTKAKIKPVSIYAGSYCPLCGGADFE